MICPRCQYDNRAAAKFCEQCATPLGRACGKCGAPLSPTARFCPECAHPASVPSVEAGRFASPHAYTPGHLAERILGLGKLDRRTGKGEQAREHLATATAMYREMDMRFWLAQAEAAMTEIGT